MVKFPELHIFVKINLMKKCFYILAAALAAVLISACKTIEEKPEGYIVGAYVTSWSDVMPDPSRVTHINYAFGHVKKTFDGVDIANEERLRSIMELKTVAPSVKFSLSIGGWGSGFEIIEGSFKNAELEVPQFVEEFSGVTVNIKREVFAAIQHGARIDDRTGKVVKGADDTNDDTKTTSALAIKLGVSKITIKRDLKVLQDLGYIEHCGPARGGYWKVLKRK